MAQRRIPQESPKTNAKIDNPYGSVNALYLSDIGVPYSGLYKNVRFSANEITKTETDTRYAYTIPPDFTKSFGGSADGGLVWFGGGAGGYVSFTVVSPLTTFETFTLEFFLDYTGAGGNVQPALSGATTQVGEFQSGSFTTEFTSVFVGQSAFENIEMKPDFNAGTLFYDYGRGTEGFAYAIPFAADQLTMGFRVRNFSQSVKSLRWNVDFSTARVTDGTPV